MNCALESITSADVLQVTDCVVIGSSDHVKIIRSGKAVGRKVWAIRLNDVAKKNKAKRQLNFVKTFIDGMFREFERIKKILKVRISQEVMLRNS